MAVITLNLDDKVIAARAFPDGHLSIEGYVEGLKQDIIEEHEEVIILSKAEVRFTITPFPEPPQLLQ